MKQKVVIKVSVNGNKSRSKVMKIAVSVSGVESAALKGNDMTEIEVTGDGMDPVALTTLLRKKVGYAELVSLGPAGGGDKKEDKMENETNVQPLVWPYMGSVPYYHVVAPYHSYHDHHSYHDPYNGCSIM